MAKRITKYLRWREGLSDIENSKVHPFYVWREECWDEGNEYRLLQFNLTKEKAEEFYKRAGGRVVDYGPLCFNHIADAREDMSFFEKHPKFILDENFSNWH